jgi:hypothetical protein
VSTRLATPLPLVNLLQLKPPSLIVARLKLFLSLKLLLEKSK